MKYLAILLIACFSKMVCTNAEVKEMIPGQKNAPVLKIYSFTIKNPKEKKITLKQVWAEGHLYPVPEEIFEGEEIKFKVSGEVSRSDKRVEPIIKKSKALVIIEYSFEGKSKSKFIEISDLKRSTKTSR